MTTAKGFTKFELLIVIAIIGAVAALSVPNFTDGRGRRSPVSRVRSDMRSIATAIETYYVDMGFYPKMEPLARHAKRPGRLDAAGGVKTMAPVGLTTPIMYVTSLFPDPFAPEKSLPFAYYTDGPGWILYSPGPDKKYDLDPAKVYDSSVPQPSLALIVTAYDPTNGSVSGGDIWRVKQ